ncbi:MAG: hypothetical protein QXU02_01825 [Candidatus Bathyarchaeia archaeon]
MGKRLRAGGFGIKIGTTKSRKTIKFFSLENHLANGVFSLSTFRFIPLKSHGA